jgi:hypothetical protein
VFIVTKRQRLTRGRTRGRIFELARKLSEYGSLPTGAMHLHATNRIFCLQRSPSSQTGKCAACRIHITTSEH